VPVEAPKRSYKRHEVCRLLNIRESALEQWEEHGFIARAECYEFRDLVALRTLKELRAKRVRPERIRMVLASLRLKLNGVRNPLQELKIYTDGRRLSVQVDGSKMEAVSGQLLLDFDAVEIRRLLAFPSQRAEETLAAAMEEKRRQARVWFERGIEMEQAGAPAERVIAAYLQSLECDPEAAEVHVNLGTFYFSLHQWIESEKQYRAALSIRPDYAMAWFNLGNVYDELHAWQEALDCYLHAIEIQPGYADAHYNAALLYQGMGDTMKALKHWREYLKLDPAGYWAGIARREVQRLRREALVHGA
jgi:tetratricopeptide (TPR) repeat protein